MKKGTTIESLTHDLRAAMARGFSISDNPEDRRSPKVFIDITCDSDDVESSAYNAEIHYNDSRTTYDGTPI